jgi:hypothetical protein
MNGRSAGDGKAGVTEAARVSFERSLRALDLGLFAHVRSQTGDQDRLSLLALHNACREIYGEFSYLEIGSHLGGSLQVLIADDRCASIVSIDSRPARQPDVRGVFDYPGNTTERMLSRLGPCRAPTSTSFTRSKRALRTSRRAR